MLEFKLKHFFKILLSIKAKKVHKKEPCFIGFGISTIFKKSVLDVRSESGGGTSHGVRGELTCHLCQLQFKTWAKKVDHVVTAHTQGIFLATWLRDPRYDNAT